MWHQFIWGKKFQRIILFAAVKRTHQMSKNWFFQDPQSFGGDKKKRKKEKENWRFISAKLLKGANFSVRQQNETPVNKRRLEERLNFPFSFIRKKQLLTLLLVKVSGMSTVLLELVQQGGQFVVHGRWSLGCWRTRCGCTFLSHARVEDADGRLITNLPV